MKYAVVLDGDDLDELWDFLSERDGAGEWIERVFEAIGRRNKVPLDIAPPLPDAPVWFSLSLVPTPTGSPEQDALQLRRILAMAALDVARQRLMGGDPQPMRVTVEIPAAGVKVERVIDAAIVRAMVEGTRQELARVDMREVDPAESKIDNSVKDFAKPGGA